MYNTREGACVALGHSDRREKAARVAQAGEQSAWPRRGGGRHASWFVASQQWWREVKSAVLVISHIGGSDFSPAE